jgi:hypothetical protein
MVAELLEKYIWLIHTFIRAGENGLTLQDISYKWENRFNTPYPRRTFNNHRRDIESIFNIVIECNRSTNCYFIDSTDGVIDDKAESAWLINTFTVNKMLSLGKERLSGRVAVENIPSGHMYLTSVLENAGDKDVSRRVYSITNKGRACLGNWQVTLRSYAASIAELVDKMEETAGFTEVFQKL